MRALRALSRRHRLLALLLVACALAMKAAVPAGFMLGAQGTVLTVQICADATVGALTKQIVIPADGADAHGKAQTACPYAALGFASLAAADPVLLALALAFILALGVAPARAPTPRRVRFLQPPLRGPPAQV